MVKAKARSEHWEWEAKVVAGKIVRVEKERDEAKEEAQYAWLAVVAAGGVKAFAEDKLARV